MVTKQAVSLTFVQYDKGDAVGEMLAYFSLLPLFILVAFVALILFRRELQTAFFFLGLLVDELLSVALKHYLQHERPSE